MNIQNLTQEEIKSLHTLLGKMLEKPKPKSHIDPINKMIGEIIEEFEFDKVHKTMVSLNWVWGDSFAPPSIEEMKETAENILHEVATTRLGGYNITHHSSPITIRTGGFEAKAWCDEDRSQITDLSLEFVVTSYDASL